MKAHTQEDLHREVFYCTVGVGGTPTCLSLSARMPAKVSSVSSCICRPRADTSAGLLAPMPGTLSSPSTGSPFPPFSGTLSLCPGLSNFTSGPGQIIRRWCVLLRVTQNRVVGPHRAPSNCGQQVRGYQGGPGEAFLICSRNTDSCQTCLHLARPCLYPILWCCLCSTHPLMAGPRPQKKAPKEGPEGTLNLGSPCPQGEPRMGHPAQKPGTQPNPL